MQAKEVGPFLTRKDGQSPTSAGCDTWKRPTWDPFCHVKKEARLEKGAPLQFHGHRHARWSNKRLSEAVGLTSCILTFANIKVL